MDYDAEQPATNARDWKPGQHRHSSLNRGGYNSNRPAFTTTPETVIDERIVEVERKTFTVKLAENQRGKYFRIIETGGQSTIKHQVVIPVIGAPAIAQAILDMFKPELDKLAK